MEKNNICKIISTRTSGVIQATHFFCERRVPHSGEELTPPCHGLYLVNSGEGLLHSAGQLHRLCTGTLFFSFSNFPFTIENTNELTYYCINFTGGRAEELFQRFGITPRNCIFEGHEGLLPLCGESLARAALDTVDLVSESLLLYAFSRLKKQESLGSNIALFVQSYLEEHFTEHNLTLSSVAAAGYHEKYLSHSFKKQFGMGFTEYLRTLRIKHAILLFENGVTSVKNVALLCGFSDPLYFSRVFTETVGVPPRDYLKK